MNPRRLVLVDDHEIVRAGASRYLEPDFEVVGEAGDVGDAVRVISSTVPDAVLIDVVQPGDVRPRDAVVHADGFGQVMEITHPDGVTTVRLDHFAGFQAENALAAASIVIAGGAGVLVLEELEHAKARGAKIYGEVVGYGATSDGYDMVAPSGEGAVRCINMAVETVGEKIDYINPHATSTGVGDAKEIGALKEIYGDNCPPISATKSLTGHSLGATGVQEAIYSLLMMQNGFICESAHITELDPEFADMPIVRQRQDNAEINTVLSNSFGFGGTNASLVFQRHG